MHCSFAFPAGSKCAVQTSTCQDQVLDTALLYPASYSRILREKGLPYFVYSTFLFRSIVRKALSSDRSITSADSIISRARDSSIWFFVMYQIQSPPRRLPEPAVLACSSPKGTLPLGTALTSVAKNKAKTLNIKSAEIATVSGAQFSSTRQRPAFKPAAHPQTPFGSGKARLAHLS